MERLMQYIWQHRLWSAQKMLTVDGRELQILDPGRLNTDSGPDFFNAKIKIDGQTWVGDIEIHVRASDWYRHRHDNDPAYSSVILHVVEKDDMEVLSAATGLPIPQHRLVCNPAFTDLYRSFVNYPVNDLPCATRLSSLAPIHISDWINALAYERLLEKTDRILSILSANKNNWEETCYITLARALGTGTNGEAFQRLAVSAPLRILAKHSDSALAIESLLFGQAGLLEEQLPDNDYYNRLRTEYAFLRNKFGLSAPKDLNWKLARMRPANFPHRRIALLACFVTGGFNLMSALLRCESPDQAREALTRQLSGYWLTHYNFNAGHSSEHTKLSTATTDSLVINVAVPLIYAFGVGHMVTDESDRMQNKAIEFLEQLAAEKNFITVMFSKAGLKSVDAFTSQALIQLYRNYCEQRKCIYCRFGHKMLAAKAIKSN